MKASSAEMRARIEAMVERQRAPLEIPDFDRMIGAVKEDFPELSDEDVVETAQSLHDTIALADQLHRAMAPLLVEYATPAIAHGVGAPMVVLGIAFGRAIGDFMSVPGYATGGKTTPKQMVDACLEAARRFARERYRTNNELKAGR
jgi:hypothetical protein